MLSTDIPHGQRILCKCGKWLEKQGIGGSVDCMQECNDCPGVGDAGGLDLSTAGCVSKIKKYTNFEGHQ